MVHRSDDGRVNHRDRLLGLTVVLLWGLNFLAIRYGLDHFPPLFFAALRFAVLAVPVLLFVPRPRVPARWLLLYGTGFGVLQFAFLFTAMREGMPTGLASLVLQSSAPFTVALGALLLRERLRPAQMGGLAVAVTGIVVIGADRMHVAPLLPLLLTLAGGLGWAFGNIGSRLAATGRDVNPLHLTLWMTVIPPLPLFALSALTEGPSTGLRALADTAASTFWPALAGLAYIVVFGTVIGSGLWTFLMSRYPAGTVAPFSLLVPIVGIAASWAVLDEDPTALQLAGGVIVIAGAFVATTGGRVRQSGNGRSPDRAAASAAPTEVSRIGDLERAASRP
ncbi:O-acetylserine/cysteine efflux transporter [Nocardia puris]|uniref:O-acetylserine/cysteine efflux transporter n=1 Tax=Nocardia puris TaxID=208602 RepID=A0A366D414_9NOCA|nr:O-acetylserine/cysteine efflux transporter [Nocardia puris]